MWGGGDKEGWGRCNWERGRGQYGVGDLEGVERDSPGWGRGEGGSGNGVGRKDDYETGETTRLPKLESLLHWTFGRTEFIVAFICLLSDDVTSTHSPGFYGTASLPAICLIISCFFLSFVPRVLHLKLYLLVHFLPSSSVPKPLHRLAAPPTHECIASSLCLFDSDIAVHTCGDCFCQYFRPRRLIVYSFPMKITKRSPFSYFLFLVRVRSSMDRPGMHLFVASARRPEVSFLPAWDGRVDVHAGGPGLVAGLGRGAGVTPAARAPEPSADSSSYSFSPMKGLTVEGKPFASQ